jgi:protein-tyrosine-phosphatase
LVHEKKLDFTAKSAGTGPGKAVFPQVVQFMNEENIDVSHHVPRYMNTEELQTSWKIVSLGCDENKLDSYSEKVEVWDDIPPPAHAHWISRCDSASDRKLYKRN